MKRTAQRDKNVGVRRHQLMEALSRFPRTPLVMLPTPLVAAPRLSAALKGPRIWLKREDLAGLGFGGSKYRILEFTLGRALADGADVVIGCGVAQSNHPQQVVCAAAHVGLPAIVLLGGAEGHVGWAGNMLLQGIGGADVYVLPSADFAELRSTQMALAEELRSRGHRPALLTLTHEVYVLSVLAYVNYMCEIIQQSDDLGIEPAALYVGSAGPTYAGMALGTMALGTPFDAFGVSPLGTEAACSRHVVDLIEEATQLLKVEIPMNSNRIHITDQYLGAGHGVTTPEAVEAVKLIASTEGIFLDPIYSGKGMAGLMDHIRQARFHPTDIVVFAHTGGGPSLFAYGEQMISEPYSVVKPGSLKSVADLVEQRLKPPS